MHAHDHATAGRYVERWHRACILIEGFPPLVGPWRERRTLAAAFVRPRVHGTQRPHVKTQAGSLKQVCLSTHKGAIAYVSVVIWDLACAARRLVCMVVVFGGSLCRPHGQARGVLLLST